MKQPRSTKENTSEQKTCIDKNSCVRHYIQPATKRYLQMKSIIKSVSLLFAIVLLAVAFPKQASAQQANVRFQVFYDELSPYGQWIDYPNYGNVWIPDAGADFVPYSTEGHWVLSNYGWTWVSDYDWGWGPFHYGRWGHDNRYGWFWVPDNEWGPSWVSWRRANGYYGWAPMAPGLSINVSFGRKYTNPDDHWVFVRERDFQRSELPNYQASKVKINNLLRESVLIKRKSANSKQQTYYVSGPAREEVQKITGRSINRIVIKDNNKPGQHLSKDQLYIYRPHVATNQQQKATTPTNSTNRKQASQHQKTATSSHHDKK